MTTRGRKWKKITVPEELYTVISDLAVTERKANWKVISDAISLYKSFKKSKERQKIINREKDNVEKVSWYILKITKSLGALHENPNKLNLSYFIERLDEIAERVLPILSGGKEEIKVILERLKELAREYEKTRGRKIKIEMNDLCKILIKLLILYSI